MKRLIAALMLALTLAACTTPRASQPFQFTPLPQGMMLAQAGGCGAFADDPQLAPLVGKVALDNLAQQTEAMLADSARPTPAERQAASLWRTKQAACREATIAAERGKTAEAITALDERLAADTGALIGELAAGKLAYGAFARRQRALVDRYNQDYQPLAAAEAQRRYNEAERERAARRLDELRSREYYYGPGWYDPWYGRGGYRPWPGYYGGYGRSYGSGISIGVGRWF